MSVFDRSAAFVRACGFVFDGFAPFVGKEDGAKGMRE
jgi:hypothetical protein